MLEVEGYISLRRLSSRLGFYLQERVADWRETNKLGHVDKWRSQSLMQAMSMKPRKLSAVLS